MRKKQSITPLLEEVYDFYISENEHIQLANYHTEMALRKLKKLK
jgi:hypothetical protein